VLSLLPAAGLCCDHFGGNIAMKRLLHLGGVMAVFGAAVLLSKGERAAGPDEAARAAAVKLFKSLSDEQKKLALKPFDDKERYVEMFPGNVRPGLPFDQLTPEQKALVEEIVKGMTSEYGAARCLEVAKQTPDNRRYVNFFGNPLADKRFAWRLAQHHLTLIYAEFATDTPDEFGPILLGGNPVKTLWDAEENILLELYASLSPEEVKAVQGKGGGTSGQPIGTNGVRIGELKEKPRALARRLLEQRLAVFSADRRKVLEGLIQKDGGADNLRFAVWGEPTRSHRDGGKYHWKIGGAIVLCDWQTQGPNHIHMTVRGRSK
jgi:hypothetical protein